MKFVPVSILVILLAACAPPPEPQRHAFFALGTLVEISVFDPPAGYEEAVHEAEVMLLEAEHRWRAFDDGELAALNRRLAGGETVQLPEEIAAGIRRARELAELSGNRFNPAMGRLVELWGFHSEDRADAPPPSAEALAPLVPAPTLDGLIAEPAGWRLADERVWLDMGAFAKGLAVESAAGLLVRRGIDNAIVNAGGDLKVMGRAGNRPWRIGVRHPRGTGVLAAVDAHHGEAVFTSGDYERFFEWQGERFHHILDPGSGIPARGLVSVTVMHADAALADAAATALFVAGPDHWESTAQAFGIDKAMVVRADGRIQLTRAMRERTVFQEASLEFEVTAP